MTSAHYLVVAATEAETLPLRTQAHARPDSAPGAWEAAWPHGRITFLHTGVGAASTALRMGQWLAASNPLPDAALNIGIAGALPPLALGTVVALMRDMFFDLGAHDRDGTFLDLARLGLPSMWAGGKAYYNHFEAQVPPQWQAALASFPAADGITVNAVHGHAAAITTLRARTMAQVETMEGAAFFQACTCFGLPCAALRGISNHIEPRNRAAWRIGPAIAAVNQAAGSLFALPR